MVARFCKNILQFAPEPTMLNAIDLLHEIDHAVPGFQWRKFCQTAHTGAIGLNGGRRDRPRFLFREVGRQSSDRDARRQSLEIHRKIHARQRLVEIVDVEHNILFWSCERTEVHQMAIAASLDRNPGRRLMPKILRHHRGSAAQEGEWICQHAFVTDRYEIGHPGTIGRGEDTGCVAIGRPVQIGVLFTCYFLAQTFAALVTFGQRTERYLIIVVPSCRILRRHRM
jgi:hypothetical protein